MACSGHRRSAQLSRLYAGVADSAEQDGVRFVGEFERRFGQRVAVGGVGHAADQRGFHLERQVQSAEHFDFSNNFGTNAPSPGRTAIFIFKTLILIATNAHFKRARG